MAQQQASLTDEQKIAVLMASMDEKISATILQQLEPGVMANVANAIRRMGIVSGEVRNKVIADCVRGIMEMGGAVQGDEKTVNSLLSRAIGEKRAAAMLQEGPVASSKTFSCLTDVSAQQIAELLAKEQPAVISVVLRYLTPEKAGEVMGLLSSEARRQAVVFMCKADAPKHETIASMEKYMASKLGREKKTHKVADSDEDDTITVVSGILQNVERSIEEELITAIEDNSEQMAKEIRDKLFTFEDIIKLSDVAMRRILQEVDMGLLSVALRNASVSLKEKFFKNMSKRAGESVKEEMEFSQKMKLSDIQEKQREVVNVLRMLEADGQITIGEGGADEYV